MHFAVVALCLCCDIVRLMDGWKEEGGKGEKRYDFNTGAKEGRGRGATVASKFILTPSDLTFFAHSLHPLRDKTWLKREREDKGDLASSGSVPVMFEKKIFLSGNMILILEAAAAELSPAGRGKCICERDS